MCFSATGSFALSAVLTAVGGASVAASTRRSQRMVAVMPLLFAAQQFTEGVVWLTIARPDPGLLHAVAVKLFLAFALVVWPTWLPMALFSIETQDRRRHLLRWLVGAGLVVSSFGAVVLLRGPLDARVAAHSLAYDYGLADSLGVRAAYLLLYLVPAILPFLVSTLGLARPMGGVLLLGLVTSLVMKQEALTSVWCFFAAVLSVLIVRALHRAPEPIVEAPPLRTAW